MLVNILSCSERSMALEYFHNQEETIMASTKSGGKTSPAKRPAPAVASTAAKAKTATKASAAARPEPVAKATTVRKTIPKAASKAVSAKPASSRSRKPAGIPLEQRGHYIEMAAYYIAERRGFAPGNPLEDWVQAEAEIDRLLAEGRLGG